MKMKLMPAAAALFGATALFAAAGQTAPVNAQQERTECRCVDRDGNEIERCSCLEAPEMQNLFERYGATRAGRPRLGVSVDQGQAARYDADGARVTDVMRGGPADEAGIREGDVIVRIDGRALTESIGAAAERSFDLDGSAPVQRLLAIARDLDPGQEVEVEYLRDGERMTTTLEAEDLSDSWGDQFTIARPSWDAARFRDQMRSLTEGIRDQTTFFERPDGDVRFEFRDGDRRRRGNVRILGGGDGVVIGGAFFNHGLEMVEVNPGLGAYFGTDEGVLIVEVDEGSSLGLEAGDVVVAVGDRAVSTPERLRRILSSYGQDEDVSLRIVREGDERTVTGRLGG